MVFYYILYCYARKVILSLCISEVSHVQQTNSGVYQHSLSLILPVSAHASSVVTWSHCIECSGPIVIVVSFTPVPIICTTASNLFYVAGYLSSPHVGQEAFSRDAQYSPVITSPVVPALSSGKYSDLPLASALYSNMSPVCRLWVFCSFLLQRQGDVIIISM